MERSFWERKVLIFNTFRLRSATKPMVMKHDISLQKKLISLSIWNESYCTWKLFVPKTNRSNSKKATNCLFRNWTFQIFFKSVVRKTFMSCKNSIVDCIPTAQVRRNTKRLFNLNIGIFNKSWVEKNYFLFEKIELTHLF